MRVIEERDYTIKPGRAGEFVALYEAHGLEIQKELLGEFLGYFISDVGELNHVVALWAYDSLDERMRRRSEMMKDPRWQGYLDKVLHLIDSQQTRFLLPTGFSPIK